MSKQNTAQYNTTQWQKNMEKILHINLWDQWYSLERGAAPELEADRRAQRQVEASEVWEQPREAAPREAS